MPSNPHPKIPKPPPPPGPPSIGPLPDGIGFGNAGSLHYEKETNNIYWNESSYVFSNEKTTLLGKITDAKELAKNLSAVLAKRLLKGEI